MSSGTIKKTEKKHPLGANALRVLEKRYLLRDEGKVETPEEMFQRVARAISEVEKKFGTHNSKSKELSNAFYELLSQTRFLPNSPTLMNAGTKNGQLSACFVLPVADSPKSIARALENTAAIHRSGGGTGFDFSKLRSKNTKSRDPVKIADGPVAIMKIFDKTTEAVRQGGVRRGANMGILRIDHPDIEEFINCKRDHSTLANFNISVGVTDRFMKALKENSGFFLTDPENGDKIKEEDPKRLFEMIVQSAWESGEPGMIFLDRVEETNPTPLLGRLEATNPCGEQPLLDYESCNLGSINLARYVNTKKEIAFQALEIDIELSIRFLDNVIEANRYPIAEIREETMKTRKIGLGLMGFADMLLQMGIPYDSKEAVHTAEELMSHIRSYALTASSKLAEERGSYPAFEGSIHEKIGQMRNATVTTIAPTGTLSIIAGCSGGIEPLFSLAYTRSVLDGETLREIHPAFEEHAKQEGFYSAALMEEVAASGSITNLNSIPDKTKRLFRTAHDITPEWHTKVQAAFQKYTDNAVSKTVNFPEESTTKDVAATFILAFEKKLKGITVYRNKSRKKQVLNLGKKAGILAKEIRQTRRDLLKQEICPDCRSSLNFAEGCIICPICGYSRCR